LEVQPGTVKQLAFTYKGCRMVQEVLQAANPFEAAALASELKGSVVDAIRSPHANHVLQLIFKTLAPSAWPTFFVEDIVQSNAVFDVAYHEFGCRVYCRMLEAEGAKNNPAFSDVILELLQDTGAMSRHMFGHHVVECALEFGTDDHKSRIVSALRKNLPSYATNRNGAYVLEKALKFGNHEHRLALARDLLACDAQRWPRIDLVDLAGRNLGRSKGALVLAMLKVSKDVRDALSKRLTAPDSKQTLDRTKLSKAMREALDELQKEALC